MRVTTLQAPHWLVVIDKGSYETLTYFLNRTMAELWRRKHGGQLYERELEPTGGRPSQRLLGRRASNQGCDMATTRPLKAAETLAC